MDTTLAPPADPLQAIVHADPAPYYAELAATRPFFFDAGLGWWVAASAGAVDAVLGSSACRVRPAEEPVPKAVAASPTGTFFGRLVRQIDGPDHAARKATVMAALGRLDVAALAKLPADQRAVVELRTWDDLDHDEIARRLGKSEANVRQLWSRAIRRLRELALAPRRPCADASGATTR